MPDLSMVRGDTASWTFTSTRIWATTAGDDAAEEATAIILESVDGIAEGDVLTVGTESHVITDITGTTVSFDDGLTDAVTTGDPVTGIGAFVASDAGVTFAVGGRLALRKTIAAGVTVDGSDILVVLEPGDTDNARGPRSTYPYDLSVAFMDGTVTTISRGLLAVMADVR